MDDNSASGGVPRALLILRVTLALFFGQWGVEKFVHPEATASIFEHFYGLQISPFIGYGFGAVELALALCLFLGLAKTVTYAALIAIHGISVAVSWQQLLHPWAAVPNHLFIASVPVLGALVALYLLRALDLLSVRRRIAQSQGAAAGR